MQRSASLVLLAFVGEVALNHIERLGHALVKVCRNGRIRLHDDVQHHRPQRVVRVADGQRNVALTLEGETIRVELTTNYFLVDHVSVSCFKQSHTRTCWSYAVSLRPSSQVRHNSASSKKSSQAGVTRTRLHSVIRRKRHKDHDHVLSNRRLRRSKCFFPVSRTA